MKNKLKNLTHTSKTFDRKQFNLYKKRLNSVNLVWCNQIIDLLENYNLNTIKDIGCNYFQFYKEILLRKLNINYFGYDIDEEFIKLGLTKFPELKKKFKVGNCEKIKLIKTDASILSAVLEHSDNPYKLLNNILKSTKKIVFIRTYLSFKSHKLVSRNQKNQLLPYNINQFSFDEIKKKLQNYNFNCFFILDESTKYSSKFKLINNKYRRYMYIVLGIKNDTSLKLHLSQKRS